MLLDIGAGILLSIWIGSAWTLPISGIWIAAGILFTLSPDADYLIHLWLGGSSRNAHGHRDLLHHPLIFIPVGVLMLYPFGGPWSVLFGLCAFMHFVHDSIGIGWGIQWLWPFRDEHYGLLYHVQPPKHREVRLPRKLLYIWEHDKIDEISARYGDEEWIRNIYLRWHPYAIIEFIVFLIALTVLLLRIR